MKLMINKREVHDFLRINEFTKMWTFSFKISTTLTNTGAIFIIRRWEKLKTVVFFAFPPSK